MYYFSNFNVIVFFSKMLTLSLKQRCQILCVLPFHISFGWFVEVGCSSCETVVILNIVSISLWGTVTLNLCAI